MKLNYKSLLTTTFSLATLAGIVTINTAFAQIIPDQTLGVESSKITPIGAADLINGGATRGTNLFHSFQEFNIGVGRGAYFSNPTGIENIFSRVTGGNPSNILGTLGVLGNANLIFLNPNGIVFGANSSLDLRGSFVASTASSLLFDNGFEFSSTNPTAPPLLTVNIPVGLGFRSNPGRITNRSVATDLDGNLVGLQVDTGKSLALIGGDVNIPGGGRLTALGGRIELGGLAEEGTVGLTIDGNSASFSFPQGVKLGNVSLSEDARVGVRGVGGGDIVVNANNFTATGGGRLTAGTEGAGNAGDITVNANQVSFSGKGVFVGSGLYNRPLAKVCDRKN